MSKKCVMGLSGVIGLLITLLLYLLFVKSLFEVPVKWLSMFFVLLSELIVVMKGITIKRGIISYARLTTSVVALIITVITTVLFLNLFLESIKGFIFVNILYLAVEAVVDILLKYFSKKEKEL